MNGSGERGGPWDANGERRLRSARPGPGTSSGLHRSARRERGMRHGTTKARTGRRLSGSVGALERTRASPRSAVEARRRSRPAPRGRASRPRVHGSVRARAPRRWSETNGSRVRRSRPVASRARRSRAPSASGERPAAAPLSPVVRWETTECRRTAFRHGFSRDTAATGAAGGVPLAEVDEVASARRGLESRRLRREARSGRFGARGTVSATTVHPRPAGALDAPGSIRRVQAAAGARSAAERARSEVAPHGTNGIVRLDRVAGRRAASGPNVRAESTSWARAPATGELSSIRRRPYGEPSGTGRTKGRTIPARRV
ncbi:MAG: hypothetical protein KatS3mg117_2149 [Geminicoccaceae bacterium]|nr:MAG: hypothetical protein KatS3mg117_2149 [Geminicoccaceae bacterium]